MERVGVTEFADHAADCLDKALAGETIEVVKDGRTVARLVPVPGPTAILDEWVAQGRATPRSGNLREFLEQVDTEPYDDVNAAEELIRMREEERLRTAL
ncbi:type II toxin-antitoxin system Phd/YefM family antitoxin [Microtetraspora malaysiensis]|uniref:Type II toxin-antitoxin system Phd/YefM family antitoxin n=1 Tax=Microtetraspora malaysiensis TaxID=161358 RepID=A0ABW6SVE9_9ACTN